MRCSGLSVVVVLSALMSPTAASAITFGNWASDQGYSPGAVMPGTVRADSSSPAIDSLDGMGGFDWVTTPTVTLLLYSNQISSIEAGSFSGLTNLTLLELDNTQLSSIEAGAFSGLTNLRWLSLGGNTALTELNLAEADFPSLASFGLDGNVNIISASLKNVVLNQTSLAAMLNGGGGGDPLTRKGKHTPFCGAYADSLEKIGYLEKKQLQPPQAPDTIGILGLLSQLLFGPCYEGRLVRWLRRRLVVIFSMRSFWGCKAGEIC
jgi:hypothetical protein